MQQIPKTKGFLTVLVTVGVGDSTAVEPKALPVFASGFLLTHPVPCAMAWRSWHALKASDDPV